ncbi:MAG: outer membrane lipoprotein carrier protein LolA [bacterium]|nr:outer membrane lipoprotein carrier protein LolA [bacterium]
MRLMQSKIRFSARNLRGLLYILIGAGLVTGGLALVSAGVGPVQAQEPAGKTQEGDRNWHSHAEVARAVQKAFDGADQFTAGFKISTKEGGRVKNMSGRLYYQKPGKIRYEFSQPAGNLIVSDGRIMWFFIRRLNAVGKQELTLKKKNASNREVFTADPTSGLKRLFRKYHYRFDTPEQPRKFNDGTFFVLDMEQREKIGGYERIRLFVDSESYLVRRAEASDGYGKQTTISFSDINTSRKLEGKLFQYQPDDGVRVVLNPLVKED